MLSRTTTLAEFGIRCSSALIYKRYLRRVLAMGRRKLSLCTVTAKFGLWALCALSFTSCVYFNTYYNAQKYFRQAEKARLEEERRAQGTARRRGVGGRESVARESSTGKRTSRGRGAREASKLYEKAVEKASTVLEKHKDSDLVDDAMFLAGRALYWQRDYRFAAQSFHDLERNFPESEYFDEAMYWRGLSLEAQSEHVEASGVYRSLLSSAGPRTAAKAGFRLGEIAHEEGNRPLAIQEYAATLEAFPDTDLRAELWLRIGETHVELAERTRLDSALVAFDRVLEEGPSDEIAYWARLNRGLVLHETGDAQAARDTYLKLLKEGEYRSFEGQTRIVLGQYYQHEGQLSEALEQYEKVRDDFPQTESSAMALYRTGQLYLQEYSDRTRAEEYFKEVGSEKSGSEGNVLAKETLADLKQLARTQRKIHRADSLAAVRLASRKPPKMAPVLEPAPDSVAADTTSQLTTQRNEAESAAQLRLALEANEQELEERAQWADGEDTSLFAPGQRRTATGAVDTSIERAIFTVAEIYRERLTAADSAAYYYEEIIRRFPASREVPRAMYNLAWIRLEMQDDMDRARPVLQSLVKGYPQSVHANAARELLGLPAAVTDEDLAVDEFRRIEAIRTDDVSRADLYLPLLDSLVARFPDADTAVKSAFLAAWSIENIVEDSTEATRRFDDIVVKYPSSRYASLGRRRRQSLKQGTIEKLTRQLAVMGRGVDADQRLRAIAIEPTREDSNALARKYLGLALRAHRREKPEKAKELYERSLEQKQRNAQAYYGLGEIAWDSAYFDDAVEYFRKAVQQDRAMGAVHHHLFSYHLQQSREDSADYYLREIIKRDRSNMEAQALVDQYPILQTRGERLDQSEMEEIDLELPIGRFDTPAKVLPLKEEPFIRHSVEARAAGLLDSAAVIVDVLVSRAGLPEVVEVFDGPEELHEEALAVAKQFLFYPAEDNRGNNPKVWVELVVPFLPVAPGEAVSTDAAAASPSQREATGLVVADSSAVHAAAGDSL